MSIALQFVSIIQRSCSSTRHEDCLGYYACLHWDLVVEVVLGLSNLPLADEPGKYRGTFDIYLAAHVLGNFTPQPIFLPFL